MLASYFIVGLIIAVLFEIGYGRTRAPEHSAPVAIVLSFVFIATLWPLLFAFFVRQLWRNMGRTQ